MPALNGSKKFVSSRNVFFGAGRTGAGIASGISSGRSIRGISIGSALKTWFHDTGSTDAREIGRAALAAGRKMGRLVKNTLSGKAMPIAGNDMQSEISSPNKIVCIFV